MVVTKDVELPTFEELKVQEVGLSTAQLMAAAPYLGKYCESINNEYMLCRSEYGTDPRPCLNFGKLVTRCSLEYFQKVKKLCLHEHNQYANCVDKSSINFAPWPCRKTQKAYEGCLKREMFIDYPGFGYFTRGRIHKSGCSKKPKDPGDEKPCERKDLPAKLPEGCEKRPARFTSRLYWMTE